MAVFMARLSSVTARSICSRERREFVKHCRRFEGRRLVLVGDNLYATNESGQTFIFKANPAQYELVAENKLGDEVYSTPAICGSGIYMRVVERSGEQRQGVLYCLGSPSPAK